MLACGVVCARKEIKVLSSEKVKCYANIQVKEHRGNRQKREIARLHAPRRCEGVRGIAVPNSTTARMKATTCEASSDESKEKLKPAYGGVLMTAKPPGYLTYLMSNALLS